MYSNIIFSASDGMYGDLSLYPLFCIFCPYRYSSNAENCHISDVNLRFSSLEDILSDPDWDLYSQEETFECSPTNSGGSPGGKLTGKILLQTECNCISTFQSAMTLNGMGTDFLRWL